LKVTVPSELEGIAYIQVTIQRDTEQLVSATIGHFSPGAQKPAELHWQNKLEAAQNVLFCKELFSQLAREAVGYKHQFRTWWSAARSQLLSFLTFNSSSLSATLQGARIRKGRKEDLLHNRETTTAMCSNTPSTSCCDGSTGRISTQMALG